MCDMTERFEIRDGRAEDVDGVVGLWLELMDFHRERDHRFARSEDGHERFREYLLERLADADSRLLVAEVDGMPAGYCLAAVCRFPPVFAEREYGAVYDLAVSAAMRRRGIGEGLFRVVREWFGERGMRRVEVGIALANPVSAAFWRKMGFEPYLAKAGLELRSS
jgi:GNAT superfamily N-acetyltransferase